MRSVSAAILLLYLLPVEQFNINEYYRPTPTSRLLTSLPSYWPALHTNPSNSYLRVIFPLIRQIGAIIHHSLLVIAFANVEVRSWSSDDFNNRNGKPFDGFFAAPFSYSVLHLYVHFARIYLNEHWLKVINLGVIVIEETKIISVVGFDWEKNNNSARTHTFFTFRMWRIFCKEPL